MAGFSSGRGGSFFKKTGRRAVMHAVESTLEALESRRLLAALAGERLVDTGQEYVAHLRLDVNAAASYRLSWGDSTPAVIATEAGTYTHFYSSDADYRPTVQALDSQGEPTGPVTPLAFDRSFGMNGYVYTSFWEPAPPAGGQHVSSGGSSIALQKDGKFVVAGPSYRQDGGIDFGIARYWEDGSHRGGLGRGGRERI